jgi:hypothetical protein
LTCGNGRKIEYGKRNHNFSHHAYVDRPGRPRNSVALNLATPPPTMTASIASFI